MYIKMIRCDNVYINVFYLQIVKGMVKKKHQTEHQREHGTSQVQLLKFIIETYVFYYWILLYLC